MKNLSQKEISAIILITIIFVLLGFKNGYQLILSLKPILNLFKIAFAGIISFATVGIIMAWASNYGIWFGKTGGAILYSIVLFITGVILF